MEIPVYDKKNKIIAVEQFKPNLNHWKKPSYMNEGGNLGLVRVTSGEHEGCLA